MYGDAGSDTYIFEDGFGTDYIIDVTNFYPNNLSLYENNLDFSLMTQGITANLNLTTSAIRSGINKINFYTTSKFGKITGSQGDDTITGNNTKTTIFQGYRGNDVITGGTANDIYIYELDDGNDIITDSGGVDILDFNALVANNIEGITKNGDNFEIRADLWEKDGDNLILDFGNGNSITINNFYTTGKLENIILLENQTPVFSGDYSATVDEGGFYILTNTDINAIDVDNPVDQINYRMMIIATGPNPIATQKWNGSIWENNPNFTQADINNGLVRFLHDGSENIATGVDFYLVLNEDIASGIETVAFNITVNPVNDPPVFSGDRTATVNEANSYIITNTDLNLTDVDNTTSELKYTINTISSNITVQEWNGSAWITSDNIFTQAQINASQIRFLHNGSETTTASFNFIASDGTVDLAQQTFDIIVNPVNDPPVFSGDRAATVNEAGSYIFTTANLNTTDVDNTASQLVYTVSGITNGSIYVNGIVSNTFTQAQINAGQVRYQHNGSETTSAIFNFTVTDGTATLASQVFNITVNPVNDPPVFSGDRAATVNEGSFYVITNADLNLTDVDNTTSQLRYTINTISSNITVQEWNGSAWITSDNIFTQAQINTSQIRFLHNGSETTTASFNFIASDGTVDLAQQTFNIIVNPVNDPPVFSGDRIAAVNEAGSYTFTTADLNTTDVDNTASQLVYTASGITNGSIYVNGVVSNTFTQAQINAGQVRYQHNGSETTSALFNFTVTDGTATLASQVFNITVNPLNDISLSEKLIGNNTIQLSALETEGYFISWKSGSSVYYKIFDDSSNILLGDTAVANNYSVAPDNESVFNAKPVTLADGKFIVIWPSGTNLYAKIYNANGTVFLDSFIVRATDYEESHGVTALAGGGFVITCRIGNNVSYADAIYTVYNTNGQAIYGPTYTYTSGGEQNNLGAIALDNGGFFAKFSLNNASYGRFFDSSGNATSGALYLTSGWAIAESQKLANNYVLSYNGTSAVIYNSTGTLINSFALTATPSDIQSTNNGNFLITWVSGTDIKGQLYDTNGNLLINTFNINTITANDQRDSRIILLENGNFLVVWESNNSGVDYDIKGKIFNSAGTVIADEFLISYNTSGDQNIYDIKALANGGFVLAFSNGADTNVYALSFDQRGRLFIEGTTGNDIFTSIAARNEKFLGDLGNDSYIFGANFGNDKIYDSSGTDSINITNYVYSDAVFTRQEGSTTAGDDLLITIGSNNIVIENYFAENTNNTAGTGYIEDIDFINVQDINMPEISAMGL